MTGNQTPASGPENPIQKYLTRYLETRESGATENTLRWVLRDSTNSFLNFLNENEISSVDEITPGTCREWSYYLYQRTENNELKPSTAQDYYAYTQAFLTFCEREGLITDNPATPERAQEFLPEDTGDRDRQFWGERDRKRLLQFVTKRTDKASDDNSDIAVSLRVAHRDKVLVYLLAMSGARGAELFRDPHDDKRAGIYWSDVNLEAGTITILGKSREREEIAVTESGGVGFPATLPILRKWRDEIQKPPIEEWPVFPTGHRPSQKAALSEAIGEDAADELLADHSLVEALREAEVPPPSISKNGARKLMKRLCESAGLDIDGEYLKPHGGRRGLGHALYERGEVVDAQTLLRHSSTKITHQSYSDIKVRQTAEGAAQMLSESGDTDGESGENTSSEDASGS